MSSQFVQIPPVGGGGGGAVDSVNGQTGVVVLTKSDIGLGNVSNLSPANLPVSSATQTALDLKLDENAAITGATKTKITYDAKGLVTSGADATTSDIAEGSNLYFTDGRAQSASISQVITNGVTTKSPSEDAVFDALALKQPLDTQLTSVAGLSYASNALKVIRVNAGETDFELATVSGGGGISSLNSQTGATQTFATGTTGTDFGISSAADTHTFNIPTASASNTGKLSSADWSTFNGKQAALGYTPSNKAGDTFTGAVIPSVIALTDGATISVSAALGNQFTVTLGGNRTLANPTGAVNGQLLLFYISQDGAGSRTITLDTKFRYGTDITATTLTTTASKTDLIGVRYNSVADKFDVISFVKGY